MWLSAIVAGYFLGAIPFGLLISSIWNIDIRRYGSGNIGATNILRVLGPIAAALVFVLDLLKGTLAVYLGYWAGGDPLIVLLAGVSAILGHMFPIFLGFKGGKGAATGLGVLLGIAPEIFLGGAIMVALLIALTRYVSVASIITPVLVAAAFFLLKKPLLYSLAAGLVAILIIIRHIPNIQRLLSGTEPRLGEKHAL